MARSFDNTQLKQPLLAEIGNNSFHIMATNLIFFEQEWNLEDLNAAVELVFRIAGLVVNPDSTAYTTFSVSFNHAVYEYKKENPDYRLYVNRASTYQLFVLQAFLYMLAIQLTFTYSQRIKRKAFYWARLNTKNTKVQFF